MGQLFNRHNALTVSILTKLLALVVIASGAYVGAVVAADVHSGFSQRAVLGAVAAAGFVVTGAFLAVAAYALHALVAIHDELQRGLPGPPRPAVPPGPGYGYLERLRREGQG